jgi:hypothetical protein
VKRWCVWYTQAGEVERIEPGLPTFVGSTWSPRIVVREERDNRFYRFYCDAIDELGALARFMEVWEKYNETLVRVVHPSG